MDMVYDAPPSRHLDAAVARALGKTVAKANKPVYTNDRDWTNANDYYIAMGIGTGALTLPAFSNPCTERDYAWLLLVVIALAERGVHLSIDTVGAAARVDHEMPVGSVTNMETTSALALAMCRALCKAAGIHEIEEVTA